MDSLLNEALAGVWAQPCWARIHDRDGDLLLLIAARPPEPVNLAGHRIRRKQVLGGLTHEYQIAA